jgi:hypothetical protein
VWLDLMRCQDLAHCSLGEFCQTRMASLRPVMARMRGQQAGRPQLVGIPECDRLGASQRDQPRPRFPCNHSIASDSRPVIERGQGPQFRSSGTASPSAGSPRSAARRRKPMGSQDRPGLCEPAPPGPSLRSASAK